MIKSNKLYSTFEQKTSVNGEKVKHKKYDFAINPNNSNKIYAYLKNNDKEFLYEDDLGKFYKKMYKVDSDKENYDIIDILKNDLLSIKNFNKFHQIKVKAKSRLNAKDKREIARQIRDKKKKKELFTNFVFVDSNKYKYTKKSKQKSKQKSKHNPANTTRTRTRTTPRTRTRNRNKTI